MFDETINFIKRLYNTENFIPLHEPRFIGNEKKYVNECIDTTFVSSVGKFVDRFEQEVAKYTGAKYAIATVNGTAALHVSLMLAGVKQDDEVITQPLTFVATCNAISYLGAYPVFVDVDRNTMGMSPGKLEDFLSKNTEIINGECVNKKTKRKIKAVVPIHIFGHPVQLEEILQVCNKFHLKLIEDAAESLGSFYNDKHTGTIGLFGTLSFNGNKTITTGGGGMILTNDESLAKLAKHITTTAKKPHRWEFDHDMVAYNYRLPNINAALGCAQMENISSFIEDKRALARTYKEFFNDKDVEFVIEQTNSRSNYWLNALVFHNLEHKTIFLKETNENGVMTRPIWKLMNRLTMYKGAQTENLENSLWLEERVVNIPSSVRI